MTDEEGLPIYTFPPDYIERLWAAIQKVDPAFAAAYERYKAAEVPSGD